MNNCSGSEPLPRRNFVKLFSGLVSSLGIPRLWNGVASANGSTLGPGSSLDIAYLEKGLSAMARAHHMSSMAGHLGASYLAGYFVGQQRPKLDPAVSKGIKGDLQRVMDGQSVFGRKTSAKSKLNDQELFAPFAKQKPDETLIDGIAEGLEKSIDKPRQSGHNVIFASLAIRALKQHPVYAKPAVIDGIRKLLALFENQSPGSGYYGKKTGRVNGRNINLSGDEATPGYDDVNGMIMTVLDEAINLKPDTHRIGYGGLVHIINHAAAVYDLAAYGYPELAARAVRSHHLHLRLWRNLPNVANEKGKLRVSKFTPHSAAYWTSSTVPYDRALLTHRVKTMFGFDELAAAVDEEEKEKLAYDRLRYLM